MKVILSVFTVSFLLFSVPAWADQTHKVKQGETLYKIAKVYGVTIRTLKESNHLSGSLIRPGRLLQIPEKSSKVPRTEKTTESKQENAADNEGSPKETPLSRIGDKKTEEAADGREPRDTERLKDHAVERGENLYRLSLRYDTTVQELMRMNHLKSKTLQIGQVLWVPSREEAPAAAAEAPVDDPENPTLEEGQVGEGDPTTPLTFDAASPDDALDAYLSELSEADPEERGGSSVIAFARKYLGVPYRFGGENPKKGIDCSAFVQRVFRYFSIDLPRTAREQFKAGIKVSKNDLRVGDLIFFRTYARYPSHVGIYMGEGKMIHASSRYKKVTITSVDLPYYKKRFIGVIRVPDAENILLSQRPAVLSQ